MSIPPFAMAAILLKALSLALTCTKGSGRSMSRCASLGPPAAFNHIKIHKKVSFFKRKQGVEEKRGWDGDAGRLHTTSSKEQLGSTEADLPQKKISQVPVSTYSSMLKGGKIKHFMHEWTKYTSEPFILNCVNCCKLFFLTQPSQDKLPHPIKL